MAGARARRAAREGRGGGRAARLRARACASSRAGRTIPAGLRAIDIVGTGGDASGSLNISTGTALLAAACGVAGGQARQPLGFEPRRQRGRARGARACKMPLDETAGGGVLRGHELHVPVRAVLPPGDEGRRAGARGARRAHGVQHSRAARESRRSRRST